MNTKAEKPKYFGPETEKPIEKIAKTAKPKIPMPPSKNKQTKRRAGNNCAIVSRSGYI